ncbi:hypothetical protein M3F32_07790 [Dietzia cinnamea]|uniref:hypothetical protein n=1 Tax=Dietzia cinnamea TaxID=321318 RepID=UPI00223AEEF0|nr:hypothetical protein [Dietzia cinnamea]MCT2264490.1 hypothetical protein [Dietzia cinnamea]
MTGRRRLRLREILPKPYVATMPEGDDYQSPPPDPAEDGPRALYARPRPPRRDLWVLTFGEALLIYAACHADAVEAWRSLFPGSAEVHDGVRSTEAGVVPVDQPYRLKGEDDGQ